MTSTVLQHSVGVAPGGIGEAVRASWQYGGHNKPSDLAACAVSCTFVLSLALHCRCDPLNTTDQAFTHPVSHTACCNVRSLPALRHFQAVMQFQYASPSDRKNSCQHQLGTGSAAKVLFTPQLPSACLPAALCLNLKDNQQPTKAKAAQYQSRTPHRPVPSP